MPMDLCTSTTSSVSLDYFTLDFKLSLALNVEQGFSIYIMINLNTCLHKRFLKQATHPHQFRTIANPVCIYKLVKLIS